ncbi:MAG TPA: DUF5060 domain-containing protein, partial [Bacteroidales bacterium]|nr:DUF5060 domain-containing protein [Bacteroidales bacterium]
MKKNSILLLFIPVIGIVSCSEKEKAGIAGELKTWHNVTLTFNGPETSEYDTINPFTDYFFNTEFSNGDQTLLIPGYFAADGNAGESSAREGNKWRVHFCPPAEGDWNYKVIFLKGRNAAVSGNGEECSINGETGTIKVAATDKASPDFRAKGRLKYTGGRYLIHSGTGEAFLKGGTDSPENLLGYADFDGTYYGGNNVARAGEATPHKSL